MSQLHLFADVEKSATLSDCGKYRYELRRVWDTSKGLVNFIGLNPSTADATKDDPTLRRCINFARDWGYGGLIMTNLFAYRLTDSRQLKKVAEPIGPCNEKHQFDAAWDAEIVVACWGCHGMAKEEGEQTRVRMKLHLGMTLKCIRLTSEGAPEHPLYLPADLKLVEFRASTSPPTSGEA